MQLSSLVLALMFEFSPLSLVFFSQGSSVLRCCLLSSKEELSRLQGTCLQLVDNLHGKRAAEQVDSAVVRLLWSGCCGQAAAAAGRQTSNAHFPPTGVVLNSLCSA